MADAHADHILPDPGHAAAATEYVSGEMETGEQVATYSFFGKLVRWGSLTVAALLLFLTIDFCTSAGFFPAAVVTLILVVAGVFALKRRKLVHIA